ncbi:cytochrome P450 [Gautieria morchelliformis]|nr:cytochrome P450 [Gautieria morchelliformis]
MNVFQLRGPGKAKISILLQNSSCLSMSWSWTMMKTLDNFTQVPKGSVTWRQSPFYVLLPKEVLDRVVGVLLCLLILHVIVNHGTRRIPKGLRLPPGPQARLIGGNAKDMPAQREWETYERWAKEYGEIVHVNVFGKPMIFLNTMEVAQDLFERRSSIYSDRFEFPMLNGLMGWNFNLGLMRYGDWWRRHRKMFYQKFHARAAMAYYHIHVKQTKTLLRSFYHSPADFTRHLRYLAAATIVEIVYGIRIRPKDDPYIKTAETALAGITEAGPPGTFLVDTIPILKYVPEWVPGAGFKKKARIWRKSTIEMSSVPFTAVKKAMEAGIASEAVAVSLLEELAHKQDPPADEEQIIQNVSGVAYAAGSETTYAAMVTFVLAMVLYPEVQKRAQAELDSVVGMSRLPVFEDRDSLPYVTALCKEVHRWHPALPLGVARRLMRDDVYGEYFIPGGSVVLDNAWSILHDEGVYGPRVNEFEPERFLQPGIIDPVAQFGFGRRTCAGRHMAQNSLWMAISCILHVFSIAPARDQGGKEIPVDASFTSGLISRPEPFQCSIVPRFARATSLILEGDDT